MGVRMGIVGVCLFWTLACSTEAPEAQAPAAPAPAPAPVAAPEPAPAPAPAAVEVKNRVTAPFVEYSTGDMQHLILDHQGAADDYNFVCVDQKCPKANKLKAGTVLTVDYEYREVMGQGVDVVINVSREGAEGPKNRATAAFVEFSSGDLTHLILKDKESGTEYNLVCADAQCAPAEKVAPGTVLTVDYEYGEVMGHGVDVVKKVTLAGG